MKASIPTASLTALSIGSVDVREVAVGPLDIGRLVLDSVHVELSGGAATGPVTAPSAPVRETTPEEIP